MDKRINTLLSELANILKRDILNNEHIDNNSLDAKFQDIYSLLISSYDMQRAMSPQLLHIYETYKEKSYYYLIWFTRRLLDRLIDRIDFNERTEKDRLLPEPAYDIDVYKKVIRKSFKRGEPIRLSGDITLELPLGEMPGLLGMLGRTIEGNAIKGQLEDADILSVMMMLCITRAITITLNKKPIFYTAAGSFLDNIYNNERFQLGRDICEELLMCGFKDSSTSDAFYIAFRFNARAHNTFLALHYAICMLVSLLKDKNLSLDLIHRVCTTYPILLRNMHIYPLAIEFIDEISPKIMLNREDQKKLDHTRFTCMLHVHDPQTPSKLAGYLDQWREEILDGGEVHMTPWVSILSSIASFFSEEFDGYQSCLDYYQYFKRFVTSKVIEHQSKIYSEDIPTLIEALKSSAKKLSHTRNETDFVSDNHMITLIASKLIKAAHKMQNVEAFLLGIAVNSDHMHLFDSIDIDEDAIIQLSAKNSLPDNTYAEKLFNVKRSVFIQRENTFQYILLGAGSNKILPLVITDTYNFITEDIDIVRIKKWIELQLPNLPFYDKLSSKSGQTFPKEESDYLKEKREIVQALQQFSYQVDKEKPAIIIKDQNISIIPHNLLACDESNIIIDLVATICPLSLDYLINKAKTKDNSVLLASISCWIPLETMDFALNKLYSDIESSLNEFSINTVIQTVPDLPLNSELNIICAHGSDNISGYPAFYAANEDQSVAYTQIGRIIGIGKVLLLFVCHSGSMKVDLFSNQILSLVKNYLEGQYEVVIAPFWALHIGIPPLWLPVFIRELKRGRTIVNAAWLANLEVKQKMPTPNAYACLHVYGNPYFKFYS